MLLKDILARELKVWPEGCESIEQDRHGSCLFKVGGPAISTYVEGIADDAETAKVTRAEWQAAFDALNAPKVVEWPSLGETVEVIKGPAGWDNYQRPMIGAKGKVRGIFKNDCDQKIVAIELISGECNCFIVECIKPARTAEQVAAEEREKAIEEMILLDEKGSLSRTHFCGLLYDANYRKQPK